MEKETIKDKLQEEGVTEQMNAVAIVLERAREFGLETEVVCFALRAIKEDPILTVGEAMFAGLGEWDCTIDNTIPEKCCNNCIHQGATGLNYHCDKCVNSSLFDWSCNCCKNKSKTNNKFCELDAEDGSAACCHGDHFELKGK